MKKIAEFIVKQRLLITILFVMLSVAGIIGSFFVKINYDLNEYIPDDSDTAAGIEILQEEFGDNAILYIMAKDITLEKAEELKFDFENVEGVLSVTTDENYYRDENALFLITMTGDAYSDKTEEAIDSIKNLGNFYYAGQSADVYQSKKIMNTEMQNASLIIVPVLLIILFLASTSYIEPLIYIAVIGVSILINMGSNLILEDISFLTNGIAALLQLALSMDYSMMLISRYRKEKLNGKKSEEAMVAALKGSFSAIFSSAFTTIAGFTALIFMSFSIGQDIGLVLGKGIIISIITVYLLMPALVLFLDKLTEKTSHKPFFEFNKRNNDNAKMKKPLGEKYASMLIKTRFILPVIFIAIIIPAYFLQKDNIFIYASNNQENSVSEIQEVYGYINNAAISIPISEDEKELQLSFDLLNISGISKVNSYSLIVYNLQQQYGEYFNESMISEEVRKQFIGTNYARIIININSAEESAESFETINEINGVLEEAFEGKTYIIGVTASALEIKNYTVKDYELVSILTILFIGIILLITFRSLLIPIILVAAIQSAFWMNMAIPYLLNQPIIFIGYIIVSCIQMGATIDYAILYTENYLNNRKNNDILTSVKIAFKSSQSVIIVSAGILAATGFILGLTSNLAATVVIGLALGRGALTSFLIVSILLPQLLIIFDKPIALTTLKLRKRKKLI